MRHHLAIVRAKYLDLLLSGRKTIECRLSKIRRPPFEAVDGGDLLWLKLPSGPIRAVARARTCEYHRLESGDALQALMTRHSAGICAAPEFLDGADEWARYCSLIWIDAVVGLGSLPVVKNDQRAWVVLNRAPRPGQPIAWD